MMYKFKTYKSHKKHNELKGGFWSQTDFNADSVKFFCAALGDNSVSPLSSHQYGRDSHSTSLIGML
jgi:hypothetical protein